MSVDRDYDTNPDRKFWDWLDKVDAIVEMTCDMSIQDLPDMDYAGSYEDGVSPKEMARETLEYAGWEMDE
jgi:hypothetical protein